MFKKGVLLLVFTIGLTILIFNLPKSVVKSRSESISNNEESHDENDGHDHEREEARSFNHSAEIPEDVSDKIKNLRQRLNNNTNKEKSVIFADSLAVLFTQYNKYDSAAKYYEFISTINPSDENKLKAGDAYYKAFTYAVDIDKASILGNKARGFYEKVLEKEPENLEVKTSLAMTYVSSSTPMKGITMLREVLEIDPDNQGALFNMGILSIQSNQYQKAVERFERVVKINPDHLQAQFFLGVSYFELSQNEKALKQFELVKQKEKDPSILNTVESYLKDLK
jgi:outer membrane protein